MATKKIALLDVEEGFRPVYKRIKSGEIELFECQTANDVERALVTIDKRADEFERIVFDTLTHLAESNVNELLLPIATRAGKIWASRGSLKAGYDEYGQTASIVNMLIGTAQEMHRRSMQVVLLAHEAVRESLGEEIEMHGPDLQKKIMKFAYGTADVVARLAKIAQPAKQDKETYPAGTRVLRLQDTPKFMAKGREDVDLTIPDLLYNPTMDKLNATYEVKPRKIVIYGPPGMGKTVLACS